MGVLRLFDSPIRFMQARAASGPPRLRSALVPVVLNALFVSGTGVIHSVEDDCACAGAAGICRTRRNADPIGRLGGGRLGTDRLRRACRGRGRVRHADGAIDRTEALASG